MIDAPSAKCRSEPGHAVIIVAEDTIPQVALQSQIEAFQEAALLTRALQAGQPKAYHELNNLAAASESAMWDWLEAPEIKTVTSLVWCPFTSPLRLLPMFLPRISATFLRVFGETPRRSDGCPDHLESGAYSGPTWITVYRDAGYVEEIRLKPDNSRRAHAERRLWRLLKKTTPCLGMSFASEFVSAPMSWIELPLVNGKLASGEEDDPRSF